MMSLDITKPAFHKQSVQLTVCIERKLLLCIAVGDAFTKCFLPFLSDAPNFYKIPSIWHYDIKQYLNYIYHDYSPILIISIIDLLILI